MTICKFFGDFMFLLEIKRKTPKFPETKTSPAPEDWSRRVIKREQEEKRKKRVAFYRKHKKIIDKYFELLLK